MPFSTAWYNTGFQQHCCENLKYHKICWRCIFIGEVVKVFFFNTPCMYLMAYFYFGSSSIILFSFYKHSVKATAFKGVIWIMVNKGRNFIESHMPTINLVEIRFVGEVIVVSIYSLRFFSQGCYSIEGGFCSLLLILQSVDWLAAFHLELLQAILFIAV